MGTSHLVQSTRAGASYGLTLAVLIVVVCIVKYPLFRFAADYAASTGETLVSGYARRGRALVVVMLVVSAVEAVAAVAGVALVTGGIGKWLFAVDYPDINVALLILAITAGVVGSGRYRVLESVTAIFVVVFTCLTVIATLASVFSLFNHDMPLFGQFALTKENWPFATAVSGWMPIGNTAALMLAAWVLAKAKDRNGMMTLADVRFDFNLGYITSTLLALCFLVMGAAVLFGRADLPDGGAQFAATFTSLFTHAIGDWSRLLVAITALAVMYSTLLAIVDGFPRMFSGFCQELGWRVDNKAGEQQRQRILLVVVSGGAGIFLAMFSSSFTAFIDLVTTLGFIAAPLVAAANHMVINGDNVPEEARPSTVLGVWNACSVVALFAATSAFFYLRLSG